MRRLALAAAAVATMALAAPGHAATAPKPQVTDTPSDAVGSQASTDIASVLWSTTGTTTVKVVKKKRITTYTPTKVVVTMTLGGAPSTQPGLRYVVNVTAPCGDVNFTAVSNPSDGTFATGYTDCGAGTVLSPSVAYAGNTVVWTLSIGGFTSDIKVGTALTKFDAYVDAAEPVIGIVGTGDPHSVGLGLGRDAPGHGTAVVDFASGPGPWSIG